MQPTCSHVPTTAAARSGHGSGVSALTVRTRPLGDRDQR